MQSFDPYDLKGHRESNLENLENLGKLIFELFDLPDEIIRDKTEILVEIHQMVRRIGKIIDSMSITF